MKLLRSGWGGASGSWDIVYLPEQSVSLFDIYEICGNSPKLFGD